MNAKLEALGALGMINPGFGQTSDLVITYGNYRIEAEALPTFTQVIVSRDHIKAIREEMEKGDVVLEFDLDNKMTAGPIPLYNVIADIPGTEKPDEYVIIGGHIDSWDGATGTTDNGTGSATTLEAARLLMASGFKPKRTIRFMLWSGEEQGLLGSRGWIKKNPEMLPKISACIVHDGGTNYVSGSIATAAMKDDFEKIFAPLMDMNEKLPFKIRVREGLPGGIGSDHDAFLSAGVPGFFWNQSGRANYTHTHHTQWDTFDTAIPEYQQHTSMVVAIGALAVANLDHLLSREKLKAPSTRQRRRLGVNLDDKMTLTSVVKDGVAGKAGLLVGDKILKINDRDIETLRDLRRAIGGRKAKMKVVYERGGKKIETEAVFPRRRR